MTLKQKLHFGTKRQRTAARHALSAKRRKPASRPKAAPRRKPVQKRHNRAAAHRPRTAKRRNLGEVVYLFGTAGNPARKGKKMAATKRSHRRAGSKKRNTSRRHVKRNPAVRRHHVRRNPGNVMGYVKAGAAVVGGAVGSKALTQLVLSTKNTGAMGYAGNAVATGALGWLAHLAFRDKEISKMVIAGGIAQIIVRIMTDQTPYGSALAGAGLGDYQTNWNFVWPQRVGGGFPPTQILPPGGMAASAPATVVTHSAAGMGGYNGPVDWN